MAKLQLAIHTSGEISVGADSYVYFTKMGNNPENVLTIVNGEVIFATVGDEYFTFFDPRINDGTHTSFSKDFLLEREKFLPDFKDAQLIYKAIEEEHGEKRNI